MNRHIFILLACVSVIGSNGLILSPVLSSIAGSFDDSIAQVSRAIAMYGLGTAIAALWLGRSLDSFGSARALRWALLLAAASQAASAFSVGWLTLTLSQIGAGFAAGVALPAIYALTADISPKGREAKTMGAVLFGWSVSLVAALPIGAFIADAFGWRFLMASLAILCLCAAILALPFKDSEEIKTNPNKMGRFTPLTLPNSWVAYGICCLFMTSFYGIFAFSGAHAVNGFNQSTTAAGLIALLYGIGFGLANFADTALDRIGPNRALPLGFLTGAVILIALGNAPTYILFVLACGAYGFINHLNLNMIVLRITRLAPQNRGAVLGLYSAITYLAVMIGTLSFGPLYAHFDYVALAYAAALLHVAAFLLSVRSRRTNATP